MSSLQATCSLIGQDDLLQEILEYLDDESVSNLMAEYGAPNVDLSGAGQSVGDQTSQPAEVVTRTETPMEVTYFPPGEFGLLGYEEPDLDNLVDSLMPLQSPAETTPG